MKKRVGILTSGGDCPGLNATIRGAAKALYQRFGDDVEIIGVQNGYSGLIHGDWREMQQHEFSGILTRGGTILGTKRTPFKNALNTWAVVKASNVAWCSRNSASLNAENINSANNTMPTESFTRKSLLFGFLIHIIRPR